MCNAAFEVPISNLSANGALIEAEGTLPEETSAFKLIATLDPTAATTSAVLATPAVPLVKTVLLLISTESAVEA